MTLNDRMQALRDKWERLSQRELTMVAAMGVTFVIMVTMIVGFLITDGLSSMAKQRGVTVLQGSARLSARRPLPRRRAVAARLQMRLRPPRGVQGRSPRDRYSRGC